MHDGTQHGNLSQAQAVAVQSMERLTGSAISCGTFKAAVRAFRAELIFQGT